MEEFTRVALHKRGLSTGVPVPLRPLLPCLCTIAERGCVRRADAFHWARPLQRSGAGCKPSARLVSESTRVWLSGPPVSPFRCTSRPFTTASSQRAPFAEAALDSPPFCSGPVAPSCYCRPDGTDTLPCGLVDVPHWDRISKAAEFIYDDQCSKSPR